MSKKKDLKTKLTDALKIPEELLMRLGEPSQQNPATATQIQIQQQQAEQRERLSEALKNYRSLSMQNVYGQQFGIYNPYNNLSNLWSYQNTSGNISLNPSAFPTSPDPQTGLQNQKAESKTEKKSRTLPIDDKPKKRKIVLED